MAIDITDIYRRYSEVHNLDVKPLMQTSSVAGYVILRMTRVTRGRWWRRMARFLLRRKEEIVPQ